MIDSRVRANEHESGPPVILYTDVLSGPNSGGENNKGIYISVFGKNLGIAGAGKSTRLYIGDVEVDNYRFTGVARGRPDIDQITAQIGRLGNPKPGVPLPVKIVVNGASSNTNHTFTVNPGTIYFVSLTGNDSSALPSSVARPFRTVQTSFINNNGKFGCPASSSIQTVATAGVWGQIHAGDFIIMREGTWTDIAKDGFFLRVQNKSGSEPTGKVDTGPITIMGYPGENVLIDRTNSIGDNQGGGGISSADSARQALGCGAWVTVANLRIESGFNDGMINVQRASSNPAGSHWRIVNNEMTGISCQVNTKCRGGGVAGAGAGGYWVGNSVHDVHDKPDLLTSFENHGFYMEGMGSYEVAYNRIENIFGGNGIQAHSTSSPITNNANIHHNFIRNVGKHGINIGDGVEANINIYNNIIIGADIAGIRFNSKNLIAAKIYNNSIMRTDRLGKGGVRAALMNDANIVDGAVEIRNNIVVPGEGRNYVGGSVGFDAVPGSLSHNLWFGGKGAPIGRNSLAANPHFISVSPGAENLRLRKGSPAIDSGSIAAESLVKTDFDALLSRPQGRGYDIGAFEWTP
ncbi:MAG: choice-of-anchor Q domain-containing protein [Betaproteobacteria bacterium]